MYDAVYLYSLALNDTLTNGNYITNTSEVITRMFNRHFQGKFFSTALTHITLVPTFLVFAGQMANLIEGFVAENPHTREH